MPNGSKWIQAGRLSSRTNSENKFNSEKKAKKKKRVHNLSQNIEDNKPSAKLLKKTNINGATCVLF